MQQRAAGRNHSELRPGIAEVLDALQTLGLKLGLAANQPLKALDNLAEHGTGHYFHSPGLSGVYGYRKPNIRLLLRICEDLDMDPRECVMVGDRIDHDIVPARLLGMRTVPIRTGRHQHQQPLSCDGRPEVDAKDAWGILNAVDLIIEDSTAN